MSQQVRSNELLFKKFSQYLIPTMITYAALSLNEFVDSMLVSNLLGSPSPFMRSGYTSWSFFQDTFWCS